VVVSGSVGDGPVVGATLQVVDAAGQVLGTDRSTDTADYQLELPAETRLPVLVTATGGIDLVTQRPLDFPLVGAVLATGNVTVNISPLTTLAVYAAQCSAPGLGAAGLEAAWQRIYADASFGLDDGLVADPMTDPVDAANVRTLVLANEALGEAVRRTMQALEQAGAPVAGAEILRQVGCDLVGGSRTGAVDARVLATFEAAGLAVRLETVAGRLEVDDYSAVARMDDAIRTIRPGIELDSIAELAVAESVRQQALRAVALWHDFAGEPALVTVAQALASGTAETLAARMDALLDAHLHGRLKALAARVALAATVEIEAFTGRRALQADAGAPQLSFSSDRAEIASGESVTLSWAASDAERCLAAGDWTGPVSSSGFQQIAGLTEPARFGLACAGLGGVTYREVSVTLGAATPSSGEAPAEPEAGTPPVGETETGGGGPTGGSEPPAPTGSETAGSEPVEETAPPGESAPESSGSAGTPTGGSGEPTDPEGSTGSEPAGGESGAGETPVTEPPGSGEPAGTSEGGVAEGSPEPAPENPTPEPSPAPAIDLDASATTVAAGGSAMLTWTASHADACTASGGWSGSRPVAGMETVGPLQASATFTLSCSGAGGTDVAMISVAVNGAVALRWQPPTQLVDGTPLPGLSGYRIYYGAASGSYLGYEEIGTTAGTEYSLQLPPGDYYIAMTAIGLDGEESGYSNEVHKVVN
jgi:hypothetical protein